MFGKALLLVIASTISVHGFAMELQGEGWGGTKQQQQQQQLGLIQLI